LGLVLLTLAGLGLGAAGGYALLWKLRQPADAPPATAATGPTAIQGSGDPSVAVPRRVEPSATVVALGGCPRGMSLVSGGSFKMGTENPLPGSDELELKDWELDSFCIDQFEFPNEAGVVPRVNVSWSEAKDACVALGKRLCTEAEWEKACKGAGKSRFPYGPDFDANKCNTEEVGGQARTLAASGSFPNCHSTARVMDLSGNVAEWTDPLPGTPRNQMMQKGGAFDSPGAAASCSARRGSAPELRSGTVGFRCCGGTKR
jgi:formylglycine-generating enzyme required for sulfatase activity